MCEYIISKVYKPIINRGPIKMVTFWKLNSATHLNLIPAFFLTKNAILLNCARVF